jgi:hypothetical protein
LRDKNIKIKAMKRHNVDVACLQETHLRMRTFLSMAIWSGKMRWCRTYPFPKAIKAWERAGQPDPIKSGNVAERERTISIELRYIDGANQIVKYFVFLRTPPCTGKYMEEEY